MIGPFIFLDIDGVLNNHNPYANGYCGVDVDSIVVLNSILDATDAKIIISSAWRYFVLRGEMTVIGLSGLLNTHGLNYGCVADVLGPDIPDGNGGADRGAAIERWFQERWGLAHEVRYLVIDDMDLGYSRHKLPFLWIDGSKGLVSLMGREIANTIAYLTGKITYADCSK